MKRNDVILIAAVLCIALGLLSYMLLGTKDGEIVVITVDGNVYKEVSLFTDQEIEIKQGEEVNIVKIQNGTVTMIEADCRDQICVKQKEISHKGESIICLPHKVVVTIEGDEPVEIDGVSE